MAERNNRIMAYNKNIPDVLQLLRLGTDLDGTTIARYAIDGDYSHRYCIMDALDDVDTMDIHGAIEETMHLILDNGGTPDDLRTAMGLVPEADIDPDIIESGEYVPVDLGYCLDGQLMSFDELTSDEIDPFDSEGAILDRRQADNVQTAFNNLPESLRLPAAKVLSQDGMRDCTEWQAFEVCKSFENGIDGDTIGEFIANPDLNHGQMRELRFIAEQTGTAAPDASPYERDIFKTLASGGFDAEHLRHARGLMNTARALGVTFPPDWLKLGSRQMDAVRHALLSDVPKDALEGYADGSYSAEHMNVITTALVDGMEKPGIERLMNHDISMEQVWAFHSAITSGRFTDEQLDLLCDPTEPADVMNAMRMGMDLGLDNQTVTRFADGTFKSGQMESIYRAASDKDLTPEMLEVIADASLTPEQMTELKIGFQQGGSVADVQAEKKAMPRHEAAKSDALKTGGVKDAAKKSREASAQLGSKGRGGKPIEREELE